LIQNTNVTNPGAVPPQARTKRADPSKRVCDAYDELRRMAAHFRRRYHPHQTLQTTELLHETYIRLAENGPAAYESQGHFFGCVGHAMHATLVDRARRRRATKRGGDSPNISLEQVDPASVPVPDFEELRQALDSLDAQSPALRQVLELRFFIGFSTAEIAEMLGRGESTVRRDCALAKAWLQRELAKD
jgi:RNA polymerase sigma factor (TIGR02999 family)